MSHSLRGHQGRNGVEGQCSLRWVEGFLGHGKTISLMLAAQVCELQIAKMPEN